ncbi:MAG: flagellar hook assembly protein FlgD [Burkholderiales bacterium]|nr:flagellar hook assembly protein FlgD [Burkholderiales bacterium]
MSSLVTDPFAALSASASAAGAASAGTASAAAGSTAAGSASAFLKLLVTQMQNQDPLNPMDNAQITSQIAQINTVSGIQQLNTTVSGLTGQFVQMQALQGASLVGHAITIKGSRLDIAGGTGVGGFDLAGTADSVKVQVLSPAGQVVDTLDLGAQGSGRHAFNWPAAGVPDGAAYTFKVVATAGAAAVGATPLMLDRVTAATGGGSGMTLSTAYSGSVAYSDVIAFN